MRTFGDTLKKLRKKKDIRQEDVAKALGVQETTISNWENNRRIPEDHQMLVKIAEFFDCTTDYLLGKEDFPKGILVIKESLESFLPKEIADKLEVHTKDGKLSPDDKEELFNLLKKHGVIK